MKVQAAYTSWTNDRVNRLITLYPDHGNTEISLILGVSVKAIVQKAYKLQLKKSREQRLKGNSKGLFKPGQPSLNKGKKQREYMTQEAIARSAETRFKFKSVILSRDEVNAIITIHSKNAGKKKRSYMFIRISPSKWMPLHLYLWNNAHGSIPAGHCLFFKDGNTLNPDLDNLELITRKEARFRNSGSTKLTPGFVARCIAGRNDALKEEILQKYPFLLELKRNQLILQREIRKGGKV